MRCATVRRMLERHARQELAPGTSELVEEHLAGCPGCRRHLASQERLAGLLAGVPEPPTIPEGFAQRLVDMAKQRQAAQPLPKATPRRPRPAGSSSRMAARLAVMAAGLLIGAILGQQTWLPDDPPAPRHVALSDPLTSHAIGYLGDAPDDSLAGAYLALTRTPRQ